MTYHLYYNEKLFTDFRKHESLKVRNILHPLYTYTPVQNSLYFKLLMLDLLLQGRKNAKKRHRNNLLLKQLIITDLEKKKKITIYIANTKFTLMQSS